MKKPIGIFDSGIGGLTVARGIRALLPMEDLIYYGDTKHLPYGEKSSESIINYSLQIADFLLDKKVKAIVIACNSASAVAAEAVQNYVGKDIPVINVIDPMVKLICEQHSQQKVTVIGTKLTINSRVYSTRVLEHCGGFKISEIATPLLAAMIEEGFVNDEVSSVVLKQYLAHPDITEANSLVLGCTHYPLLAEDLSRLLPVTMSVLSAPETTANQLQMELHERDLLATDDSSGSIHAFVSEWTSHFEKKAIQFLGESIHLSRA